MAIINGTSAANVLNGTAVDDQVNGLAGNDTLNGLGGNDTLDGGTGNDTMAGGIGNDTYIVDSISDVVTEAASAGTDTVRSSVTWTLGVNLENLVLTGTAAINGTGNTLNNVITGNSAANILNGGLGNDTMIGGLGNDTYVVNVATDIVTEAASAGTDTVQSAVTLATLALNVENLTLTGTAAINGTGNTLANVLTGNTANNILNGGSGNDTLNGGLGNDTMIGGLGDDTFVVNVTTDIVTEAASQGIDTVQSAVTIAALALNVENLTLTGTAAINGTGNTLDNVIVGNSANNVLNGGTAGNDTLNGGAGNDTMVGGAGNDTYVVDAAGDIVTEAAGAGTDLVQSSATFTLGLNVENLTLTGGSSINGTGNTLNNVITGNGGNNVLNGGAGVDTLIGGLGNDTYVVDSMFETVTEAASGGIDTVQAGITYSIAALTNVENLTLTGTAAIDGTGNAGNNVITGNSNENLLDGGAGNDTLNGGLGDDILIGRAGADTLNGAEGHDTLLGGADNDMLSGGAGGDQIYGDIGNDTLSGGADDDALSGGAGNDVLDGGSGEDILLGQAGDDTLVWDAADAIINGGSGTDTLSYDGLPGQALDLNAIPNEKIQDIEIIDITGTVNNTLNLTVADVLALNSTDTLRVEGGADDVVVSPNDWIAAGTTVINSQLYHVFTGTAGTSQVLQVRDGVEFNDLNFALTITAAEDTSAITEDDSNPNLSVTGQIDFDDLDEHDVHTVSATPDGGNTLGGTFGVVVTTPATGAGIAGASGDGTLTWTYTLANADTQSLAQGETATETFTITIDDGQGGTVTQDVTLTVTGVNDAPVGVNDNNTADDVIEAGVIVAGDDGGDDTAAGDVLTNDDDVDNGAVLTVTEVNGVAAGVGQPVPGTYGSVTIDADGDYTYTLNDGNPATDALAQGETATDVFTYKVSDAQGGSDTATLTINITGSNDAPTVTATAAAAITEAADASAQDISDTGTVSFNDVDATDVVDITFASNGTPVWSGGTIDPDLAADLVAGFSTGVTNAAAPGSVDWDYSVTDANLDFLADGETITFSYTVTATDSEGATDTDTVSFTLTGANDAPVTPLVNQYASSVLEYSSQFDFELIEDDEYDAIQALGAPDTFTHGDNPTAWAPLLEDDGNQFITVGYDTPVYASQVVVRESYNNGFVYQIDVRDTEGTLHTVWTGTDPSQPGSVVDFAVNFEQIDYLVNGVRVYVNSEHVQGSWEEIDAIQLNGSTLLGSTATGLLTEQLTPVGDLTESGTIAFGDLDLADAHLVSATGTPVGSVLGSLAAVKDSDTTGSGTGGALTWTYTVAAADVEYLAEGEMKMESFTITLDDQNGGIITRQIDVMITGTNDAPVLTVDASGAVTEDVDVSVVAGFAWLTDSGTLSFTDTDTSDVVTTSVTDSDAVWSGGTLSGEQITALTSGFTVDGDSWDYEVNNNDVQFLSLGETLTLTFDVTATDDSGAGNDSDTETVTITITGTNDAPVLTVDTALDIVVTNQGSDNVGVLAGDGAGGFTAAVAFGTGGTTPNSVALGDVNGDSFLDIVVANNSSDDVGVLAGDGAGGFTAAVVFDAGGLATNSVALGDVNGDDFLDIVVANSSSDNVGVLEGDGAGGFAAAVAFGTGGSAPVSVALGDVNGDGFLDIAAINTLSDNVGVLAGDGAGGFVAALTFASGGSNPGAVALGDVNGDGFLDIVAANFSSSNVGVLTGDGAGGFAAALTFATGGSQTAGIALGDVNGDGFLDIVAGHNSSNNVGVLAGDGAGGFASAITFATGGSRPTVVALGDVNGDGFLDIVTANFDSGNVGVLAGDGAGGFAAAVAFGTGGTNPNSVALGRAHSDNAVTEDAAVTAGNLTDSGTISVADADVNDTATIDLIAGSATWLDDGMVLSLTAEQVTAFTEGFTVDANSWDYTVANADVQFLGEGDTVTLTGFTVRATDSSGAGNDSDAETVTITINGANDAPVLTVDASGGVTEDVGAVDGILADSGTLSFTDADTNDMVTVSGVFDQAVWPGGTLTAEQIEALTGGFAVDGNSWDYSVDNSSLQFLGEDETVTLTFDVTATDDSGAGNDSDTETVTITLTGNNDAPTVDATVTAGITELAGASAQDISDTGTVHFTDVDSFDVDTSVTYNDDISRSGGGPLAPGLVTELVDGLDLDDFSGLVVAGIGATVPWTYSAADLDLDFLAAGETLTWSYDITATDEHGATGTDTMTFTITGTNDAPVAVDDDNTGIPNPVIEAGAAGAGDSSATGDVLANDTDVDGAPFALTVTAVEGDEGNLGANVEGDYGSVLIHANGSYSYNLNNAGTATNALTQGQTVTDVFSYTVEDVFGATSTAILTITITGSNDAAVITGTAAGDVFEDGVEIATGDLDATDVDGAATFQAGGAATTYGAYTVDTGGAWSYDLNNANTTVQALSEDESLIDTFDVLSADGTSQTVTITITGNNDTPELTVDTTLDIVVTNPGSNNVGMLAGDGAGGFAAAAAFGTGGSVPNSVALGDVNGDDFLDIVVANNASSNVGVLAGDGVGGFATAVVYGTGGSASNSVALGDVNGDSFLDIVVANNASSNVGVLAGDGVGGFATAVVYGSGSSGSTSVALGDVNGDSFLDIVTANNVSNNAGVLAGDGAGGFAAAVTFGTGGSVPNSVALGDVNGDSFLDIVTANTASNNAGVLAGDGAGGFAAAVAFGTGGSFPFSVALGDVNGDSFLDIVTTNFSSNNVSVLAGDGAGGFAAALSFATGGSQTAGIALGDVNGDGFLDIVAANHDSGSVGMLAGDGVGGFAAAVAFGTNGINPVSVALGSTHSDGAVTEDVAVTAGNLADSGTLSVTDADASDVVTVSAVNTSAVWSGGTLTGPQAAALTGGFTVDGDGWDYTVANADVQFLGAGETVALAYDVTATDDSGALNDSDTETVTITITGANDPASITGDFSGAVFEDGVLTDAADLNVTDVDTGEAIFQADSGTTPYGAYTVGTDGWWTYDLENNNVTVQALSEDEELIDTFDVLSADGTSQTVTITITGLNDAPVAVADGGAVQDAAVADTDTGNVLGNDTDIDTLAANLAVTQVAGSGANVGNSVAGTYGSVTINANGTYTYTLDNNAAATNALAAGATATDVFSYQVTDDFDAVSTADLTITVTGNNNAPAGTDGSEVIDETGVYTFTAVDFGFTDPVDNPDDAFVAVQITSLPVGGLITLNSVAIAEDDFISVTDISTGLLRFEQTPAATGLDTFFDFKVQDGGGEANDGVDLASSANTIMLDLLDYLGDGTANSFPGTGDPDRISGLGDGDTLAGGEGDDTIWGGTGLDDLTGGAGADTIHAGADADVDEIIYNLVNEGAAPEQNTGYDIIAGFVENDDRIHFAGSFGASIDDGGSPGTLVFAFDDTAEFGTTTHEALLLTTAGSDLDAADLIESGFTALLLEINSHVVTDDTGDTGLIVVQTDDNSTGVYYFQEVDGNNVVDAVDLSLVAIINGALLDDNNFTVA